MLTMCSAGRQAGRHALSVTHTLLSSGGSGFLWSSLDFCFFDSPLQRPGWGRLNSIWCVCGCGRVCVWVNFVYSLSISLSCSKSFFSAPLLSLFLCPLISFKRWLAITLFFIIASFGIQINPYLKTCMQWYIKCVNEVQQALVTITNRQRMEESKTVYSYNVGYRFMSLPLLHMKCAFGWTSFELCVHKSARLDKVLSLNVHTCTLLDKY